jgi:hypothetical protein
MQIERLPTVSRRGAASHTTDATPARASSSAAVNPTGPPPPRSHSSRSHDPILPW